VRSREAAARLAVEADPVGVTVVKLMDGRRSWRGTAERLLEDLRAAAGEGGRRALPATAHHLSGQLRRVEPALRRLGLEVRRGRTRDARTIEIWRVATEGS
jgi:hypothetical protein